MTSRRQGLAYTAALSLLCLLAGSGLWNASPIRPRVHERHHARERGDRSRRLLPATLPGAATLSPAALDRATAVAPARWRSTLADLPLAFEANQGQTDSRVEFLTRGSDYTAFLSSDAVTLALRPRAELPRASLRMTFPGATPGGTMQGIDPLPGVSNYFHGDDPAKWRSGVPHFQRVERRQVYPGVDLLFYGAGANLEFDFRLAPDADPGQIRLRFDGPDSLDVSPQGDLHIALAGHDLLQKKPLVYQESAHGRLPVEARFVLLGRNEVGVEVPSYDRQRELVIDPVLQYSTYVGGSGDEGDLSVAADAAGNVFLLFETDSADFPTTTGAYDTSFNGATGDLDAVVLKLNPDASSLVFSTFLGGNDEDLTEGLSKGIAVDAAGNVYATGFTLSGNFPRTTGAYDLGHNGETDTWVTKLSSDGRRVLYSTFLGGPGFDDFPSIAVDSDGDIYVAIWAELGFPTTAGAFDTSFNGGVGDIAVVKLHPAGQGNADLVYSTFIGGPGDDGYPSLVIDKDRQVYVVAETNSRTGIPVTPGAFQQANNGGHDLFVAKMNLGGQGAADLLYCTYFGGSNEELRDGFGSGIGVDGSGDIYITSETSSTQNDPNPLPVTTGAFQTKFNGGLIDLFVARIHPAGQGAADLVYSTYLGGSRDDEDSGLVVDEFGYVYMVGATQSTNYPLESPVQNRWEGGYDVILSVLDPSGSRLVFSTYLGGKRDDFDVDVFVDGRGDVYLAGATTSVDFPTTEGAYSTTRNAMFDVFAAKITEVGNRVTTVSAASFSGAAVAPDSIASAFGSGLAAETAIAQTKPLPTELGGARFEIIDNAGTARDCPFFYVSPGQLNLLIPEGTALGPATLRAYVSGQLLTGGTIVVNKVAPGLFTANGSGSGAPAAFALHVAGDGTQSQTSVYDSSLAPVPLDLGSENEQLYLLLFATGIRGSTGAIAAKIGGETVPVLGAAPQGEFVGLDQVNLGPLPRTLIGRGTVDLGLTVDGVAANTVSVRFQ